MFDLSIEAEGDTWIDDHHTNEDLGTLSKPSGVCSDVCRFSCCTACYGVITCLRCAALAFGGALSQALGDRKGIHRFGDFSAPLDEALVHVVLVSDIIHSHSEEPWISIFSTAPAAPSVHVSGTSALVF